MNVAQKMIFISIGCFACIGAQAQINCASSSPSAGKLACLVPYSFSATRVGTASQDAIASAIKDTSIFNGAIGSQLSQLPLAASAPGAIILTIHGNPEAYNNLGPVLVDRPDSVGQGRLVLGFSAQQFSFKHLDGYGIGAIGSIPLVISPTPQTYYAQNADPSLKYNQYVMLAAYGFPKKIDVSVVVPYTRISMGVFALNTVTYFGASTLTSTTPGSSAVIPGISRGVGDVILNAKHVLWSGGEAGRGSVAAGVAVRLPTGDAANYLGSGAYGVNLYGLAAYKAKVSPHVKIGYQWNSDSVLSYNYAAGTRQHLPGGLQTAVGVDYGVTRHLTLSADLLTNQFQNSPSFSVVPYNSTALGAASTGTSAPTNTPCTPQNLTRATTLTQLANLCTADSVITNFTSINFSGGIKWKPAVRRNLILYANVLIQTNDVGLRSEPSPSVGISYNFNADKWPEWLYRRPGHW